VKDKQVSLKAYFETQSDALYRAIRQVVMRSGVTTPDNAGQVASEVLNEVVVEALAHAGRLQTPEQPFAWLMGIALNLIRRRLTELSRRERREPLLHDLYPSETLTEAEVIDRFIGLHSRNEMTALDLESPVARLLAQVSPEDEQVLRLAVLHDLDGEALARELGITPGAARVRLHRALKRLRQFWGTHERVFKYDES
jgi:RNA polymerase sigma factor (sigma-70 family)